MVVASLVVAGELRCYCNESGCVSTGYMCKSPAGQCYTAVEVQGETTRATHGCLDSVPVEQRGLCGRQAADKRSEGGGGGRRRDKAKERSEVVRGGSGEATVSRFPLLICCGEDMCNYIENIDFSSIATLTRTNGTLLRGKAWTARLLALVNMVVNISFPPPPPTSRSFTLSLPLPLSLSPVSVSVARSLACSLACLVLCY